eukprot:365976-Chlamydomonas_euryale.AAC.13
MIVYDHAKYTTVCIPQQHGHPSMHASLLRLSAFMHMQRWEAAAYALNTSNTLLRMAMATSMAWIPPIFPSTGNSWPWARILHYQCTTSARCKPSRARNCSTTRAGPARLACMQGFSMVATSA